MNVAPQTAGSFRYLMVAGFGAFLLLTAIGGLMAWQRYSHARNWTPALAEIAWTGAMCEVERKSGSNWNRERTLTCEQADAYIADNQSLVGPRRRSREVAYVEADWEAGGQAVRKLVPASAISSARLAVGDKAEIVVDPDNPENFDKPFDRGDMKLALIMSAFGAGIWAAIVLLGQLVISMNAKLAARRDAKTAVEPK
jgi:hypothetical protein